MTSFYSTATAMTVHPDLLSWNLNEHNSRSVAIRLRETPFSLPKSWSSRPAGRQGVYDFLSERREKNQHSILAFLADQDLSCFGYWITNRIICSDMTYSVFSTLLGQSDLIEAMTIPKHYQTQQGFCNAVGVIERDEGMASIQPNLIQIGAPTAWNRTTGEGVTVGVIDGGALYTHEALKPTYRGFDPRYAPAPGKDGADHNFNWMDYVYKRTAPFDSEGHGTHVTGLASGTQGIGVAPGSRWIHSCACNFAGDCENDWLLSAAQWMLCPTSLSGTLKNCSVGADVVSCSWGSDNDPDPFMMEAVDAWLSAGMVPVFAVGNSGPDCDTVVSPADYPGVMGVGAVDKTDLITGFSSRGSCQILYYTYLFYLFFFHYLCIFIIITFLIVGSGAYANKTTPTPDVTAPGLNIVSASCTGDRKCVSKHFICY
jgi:hypothetical protein